jgi:hypothetical protein
VKVEGKSSYVKYITKPIKLKAGEQFTTKGNPENTLFKNWDTKKAGTGASYKANAKERVYKKTDLYAQYLSGFYKGTVPNSYGYGGIIDIKDYLEDRYGGTATKSSEKLLSNIGNSLTRDWQEGMNCTIVATTSALWYHYKSGKTKIDNKKNKIYQKVLAKAKKYGWTGQKGTFPTKINNVIEDVLIDYGYKKSVSNGHYLWGLFDIIQGQIDNITRGYYAFHSVAVNGYVIYKTSKKVNGVTVTKTHKLIAVYDGWGDSQRYIDADAFGSGLLSEHGSINTIFVRD